MRPKCNRRCLNYAILTVAGLGLAWLLVSPHTEVEEHGPLVQMLRKYRSAPGIQTVDELTAEVLKAQGRDFLKQSAILAALSESQGRPIDAGSSIGLRLSEQHPGIPTFQLRDRPECYYAVDILAQIGDLRNNEVLFEARAERVYLEKIAGTAFNLRLQQQDSSGLRIARFEEEPGPTARVWVTNTGANPVELWAERRNQAGLLVDFYFKERWKAAQLESVSMNAPVLLLPGDELAVDVHLLPPCVFRLKAVLADGKTVALGTYEMLPNRDVIETDALSEGGRRD